MTLNKINIKICVMEIAPFLENKEDRRAEKLSMHVWEKRE